MCGIAGLISLSGRSNLNLHYISSNIANTLKHRGPDNISTYSNEFVGISHSRLSIRDLNSRSNQPYISPFTGSVLSYNGEIYNINYLHGLLDTRYKDILTHHSDTAVLSALLDMYGLACLKQIVGTFAFAWFDIGIDSLFLVRDRLGVKPLYYTFVDDHLYFASEITALKPFISNNIDHQSFSEYLWFGNRLSKSQSFYKDISSVEPASIVRISNGQYSHSRWWQPDDWMQQSISSANIPAIFDESISNQLISDVPICLLLSGGIDSSFLSSYIHGSDIKAIYADFGNPYSTQELRRAKFVSDQYSIPFESVSVKPDLNTIEKIQIAFGEPFADPATIPLDSIYESISSRFRVCIQGDGADELFSGYSRHKFLRYRTAIHNIAKPFSLMASSFLPDRARRLADLYSLPYKHDLFSFLMTVHTPNSTPISFLRNDYAEFLQTNTDFTLEFKRVFERYSYCSPLFIGYLCDLLIQLPAQFFPKVDITSMLHSLEARVPLADDNLLRLSLNLSDKNRVRFFRGKRTLRQVFSHRATKDIHRKIVRQRKKGFNTPFPFWLKNQLSSDFKDRLLDHQFHNRFNFNIDKLSTFVEDYIDTSSVHSPSKDFVAFQLFCLSFHI